VKKKRRPGGKKGCHVIFVRRVEKNCIKIREGCGLGQKKRKKKGPHHALEKPNRGRRGVPRDQGRFVQVGGKGSGGDLGSPT